MGPLTGMWLGIGISINEMDMKWKNNKINGIVAYSFNEKIMISYGMDYSLGNP